MQRSRRRGALLAASLLVAASGIAGASTASAETGEGVGDRLSDLRLDQPLTGNLSGVDTGLLDASGQVEISIRLAEPAGAAGGNAATIASQQAAVTSAITAAGGRVEGTVDTVLNAVFATIDAGGIESIVNTGVVASVKEVAHYELDLDETVPYIGGTAVQDTGNSGEGITVAVLDSGVDYTHADLGGGGTLADYEAAFGANCVPNAGGTLTCDSEAFASRDGLFPTAKVVEGFDFVGEEWPNGDRTEDDDPIDYEGHGTHVADIIAGAKGVAPGASIVGVKVCSAVSSSCNGIALIKGMEYSVDQGVDIINMSLGSNYGQAFDDDLSLAADNATLAGVLTVSSAGNGSNKPYIQGSPAGASTVLSVAQTAVPGAVLPFLTVLGSDGSELASLESVFQDWSLQPDGIVGGPFQYADGAGGNLNGCAPFAPGSLTGLVVLVDRGACTFSLKIANVANGGGAVGIIGLVAPGDPFNGGFSGGAECDPDGDGEPDCDDIPGYMISQGDSNALKASAGISIEIDPANGLPLIGTMVGSSSRGPSMGDNLIKPEIGAPGASISAEAGTGTGVTPFGGTSGASPMVAGAAALVLADAPSLAPLEVKALLVNTAETDIETAPGAGLAPITRIGGGEVRVDRAVASSAYAWEAKSTNPTLSYGFVDVHDEYWAWKKVEVTNTGSETIVYDIATNFRYADDAANGAVDVYPTQSKLRVRPGQTKSFQVVVEVDGSKLREWVGDSGINGANPAWLDLMEYDGYVTLTSGDANDIHVPWHVLPRKASDPVLKQRRNNVTIKNKGVSDANLEVYNLIALSDDLPEGPRGGQAPTPDFRAAGVAFYPGSLAGCGSDVLASFAVNTWEPQTMSVAPALFEFDIDVNGDEVPDYAVYNVDLSLLLQGALTLGDGRNAVYAENLATGEVSVFFFTDHDTNSTNTVLTVCGEQVGLDSSVLANENVGVGFAVDLYYGGPGDVIEFTFGPDQTASPLQLDGEEVRFLDIAPGDKEKLKIVRNKHQARAAMVLVRNGARDEALFVW